ncbi:hypothetical protein EJ06DRAFT_582952 [Trichodelitschia bisporula]|uniref:PHD finger domain-containing protein n=1 Tax=Trichodelitschia bisporula TaxID=703511 RepID=A0A6G1HV59_9PEZI|nr:hypothetical protein EJ06DRAFT_582952 [Trichodelitschia bisporula]
MAPALTTPNRSAQRRPGRPRARASTADSSEPPRKKVRYVPGGVGGGGRYIDDNGNEISPQQNSTPRPSATSSRTRPKRRNEEQARSPSYSRSPTATYSRLRREPPPPRPRYTSAAAAVAMTNYEGYKPREERGWEEFHPDLDTNISLATFSADQVDAQDPAIGDSRDGTPSKVPPPINSPPNDDTVVMNTPGTLKRRVGRPRSHMLTGIMSPPRKILPLPVNNPKERLSLPKPSFRKVDPWKKFEDDPTVGINFVDKQLARCGYLENDIFIRPEGYIIAPSDPLGIDPDYDVYDVPKTGQQTIRSEYDMDEQDSIWLQKLNENRSKEGLDSIRPAIFEITMTQIEREWHALNKRIPKPPYKGPHTRPRAGSSAAVNGEPPGEELDTKCAVCDDGDCENTNAIVFCDGCDLAVHQECYGVPFIPEGQWHCRKCQMRPHMPTMCEFCPSSEGAFKPSNDPEVWSHLLCALWISELSVGNMTFMEPVQDVEKVPKARYKLVCYICQQKTGACVQCHNINCYSAFHVTCARRAQLCLRMKNDANSITDTSVYKCYCDKHTPADWRKEHNVEKGIVEAKAYFKRFFKGRKWGARQQNVAAIVAMPEAEVEVSPNSKRKRQAAQNSQHDNEWRLPFGAPIIPAYIFDRVLNTLTRFMVRKRPEYLAKVCAYWTLKREARRNAPLLRGLDVQAEPSKTVQLPVRDFAAEGAAGGPPLQRRIEFAEMLSQDIHKVLEICDQIQQREDLKYQDMQLMSSLVDTIYFPIIPLLWPVVDKALSIDTNNRSYFKDQLNELKEKLILRQYETVLSLVEDLAHAFTTRLAQLRTEPPEFQKHVRGRAQRIAKYVMPMLMEAARNEAELCPNNTDSINDTERIFKAILDKSVLLPGERLEYADDGTSRVSKGETHIKEDKIKSAKKVNRKRKSVSLEPEGDQQESVLPDADAPTNGDVEHVNGDGPDNGEESGQANPVGAGEEPAEGTERVNAEEQGGEVQAAVETEQPADDVEMVDLLDPNDQLHEPTHEDSTNGTTNGMTNGTTNGTANGTADDTANNTANDADIVMADAETAVESLNDTLKVNGTINGEVNGTPNGALNHSTPIPGISITTTSFRSQRNTPAVPTLSISASTDPSPRVGPATPLTTEQLLASRSRGGVPWYLSAFDPDGTTVYDERVETPRDMSEDLSELDDEALNGLVEQSPDELTQTAEEDNAAEVAAAAEAAAKKKARAKRRRAR